MVSNKNHDSASDNSSTCNQNTFLAIDVSNESSLLEKLEDEQDDIYLSDYDKLGSQRSGRSRWRRRSTEHSRMSDDMIDESSNNFTNQTIDDQESSQTSTDDEGERIMAMLQNALMNAASLSFGIYATEAWVYDEEDSLLINVGDGLQVHRSPQGADEKALNALERISNASKPGYVPPTPISPGVGLAGVLWSESSRGDAENDVVMWRDLYSIASDPDQPHDDRLQLTSQAGFRLVTGIPFNVRGTKGLVIYYANSYADKAKLVNIPNERFMCSQADLIGSIFAAYEPTLDAIELKETINAKNWRHMKLRLLSIARFGGNLLSVRSVRENEGKMKHNDGSPQFEKKENGSNVFGEKTMRYLTAFKDVVHDRKDRFKRKFVAWSNKCKGGIVKAAPPMKMSEVMWTFIGVSLTHLVVSRLHQFIKDESNGQYTLVLAPIGSITALQYALTPAPSAQPRNIIFGQTLAISIGLLLTYIPNGMPDWLRFTLAPALAIPAMAMVGIPHPPAGATAIVFSSGELDWIDMCIFVTALCLSILMAVVINNLSDMRQYPTNWFLCNAVKQLWDEKRASFKYRTKGSIISCGRSGVDDEMGPISSPYNENFGPGDNRASLLQWVSTGGGKGSSGSSRRLSKASSFRVDKNGAKGNMISLKISRRRSETDFSKFVVDKTSVTGIRMADEVEMASANSNRTPKFPSKPKYGVSRQTTA